MGSCNSENTATRSVKADEWAYMSLEIVPDSSLSEIQPVSQNESIIDKVVWKTIILASLGKLYGLVGEASHFDVLQNRGLLAIIRIQLNDRDKFMSSLMSYTFNLGKYSSDMTNEDVNAYIKVNKCHNFLGLVYDPRLVEP